jgi:hypothetical protein
VERAAETISVIAVRKEEAVKYRFVVLDRGLDSSIYKIARPQTARLKNEIGDQEHEIYEDFDEAKEAALLIVGRYDGRMQRRHRSFAERPQEQVEAHKSRISSLTEDSVETFFI